MNLLDLDGGKFLLLLTIGPLIMRLPLPSRQWFFALISGSVFMLALPDWKVRLAVLVFTFLPLLQLLWFRTRSIEPMVVLLVTMFVWLNGYIRVALGQNSSLGVAHVLGLSYILFREIEVLALSSKDQSDPVNAFEYFGFLMSFWTILAGPIQRYPAFVAAFRDRKGPNVSDALMLLNRAVNGLLKVLLMGTFLLNAATEAGQRLSARGLNAFDFAVAFYGFAAYMYLNFSGYCDLVIAAAGWAGFALPENFNKPWLSRDMVEFWNRWHITLSEWARDYIFQPLFKRLLRERMEWPNVAQYEAILVTFLIVGLWHGSTSSWSIFGLFQSIGVVWSVARRNRLQKTLGKQGYKAYSNSVWRLWLGRAICFHYVCASFLFIGFAPEAIAHWVHLN